MAKKKQDVTEIIKKLNQDIESKELQQFYLLFGAEDFLKRQYRDNLTTALVDKEDTMNYNYFDGDKLDVQNVLDIGDTLPFFAEKRVIVLENTGLFKKAPEGIDGRMDNFPDSTHVIFVEREVDGRSRLYKWISKQGCAAELNSPDAKTLAAWIKGLCKEAGKEIGKGEIDYLLEHLGTDMLMLKNELQKLFSFRYDSTQITVDDIREICVSQAEDKMFVMLDAIGEQNQQKALLLYHDLLALREPAMRVLSLLTRHYHMLMQISLLKEEGKDNGTIAELCGLNKSQIFVVNKYAAQARKYSDERLRYMLEKCQETDQGIKTGKIQDTVGVELLIVEFSSAVQK